MNKEYENFIKDLQTQNKKFPDLISNIFTMREIGNKTHGDLAEIALNEFVNKNCENYISKHVGKELFRQKVEEEDIVIIEKNKKEEIPISLKAYGIGPLQISTDKEHKVFPFLESFKKENFNDINEIYTILNNDCFNLISKLNLLALIYKEDTKECNIMVFDFDEIKNQVTSIKKILPSGRRKYPIYIAYHNNDYLFEIRYGGKDANALQRGIWTNTKKAESYMKSISNGWISYETRENLLLLLSSLLIKDNNTINKILLLEEEIHD